jgi:hypothetical protein
LGTLLIGVLTEYPAGGEDYRAAIVVAVAGTAVFLGGYLVSWRR